MSRSRPQPDGERSRCSATLRIATASGQTVINASPMKLLLALLLLSEPSPPVAAASSSGPGSVWRRGVTARRSTHTRTRHFCHVSGTHKAGMRSDLGEVDSRGFYDLRREKEAIVRRSERSGSGGSRLNKVVVESSAAVRASVVLTLFVSLSKYELYRLFIAVNLNLFLSS